MGSSRSIVDESGVLCVCLSVKSLVINLPGSIQTIAIRIAGESYYICIQLYTTYKTVIAPYQIVQLRANIKNKFKNNISKADGFQAQQVLLSNYISQFERLNLK